MSVAPVLPLFGTIFSAALDAMRARLRCRLIGKHAWTASDLYAWLFGFGRFPIVAKYWFLHLKCNGN